MTELDSFINQIKNVCDLDNEELNIEQARKIIKEINEFLYANYDGIGTVSALGDEFLYFSDFHKYWHQHYEEILNISIDDVACEQVATALHEIYKLTNGQAFYEVYPTNGLNEKDICRIRFLTANQDFRGSRVFKDLSEIFLSDNSVFDEHKILEDPEDFIKSIGITDLSQNDKRVQYAKTICQYLINQGKEPYEIIDNYNRDVYKFRTDLTAQIGSGYGNKKADMFIRDMVVLGIWNNVSGFDEINVASDINTIKVALRTGILKTAIPLVSSFIDIFCYQYGYVDDMNAKAWRRVWELWKNKFPAECLESPCLLDYFIYNVVGKQFCKEILCLYKCNEQEHIFKWHSSRNQTCQICFSNGNRGAKATLIKRLLPCTDEDGAIAIHKTDFVRSGIVQSNFDACPFKLICGKSKTFYLDPPKSISIKGQTGWTSAYAKKGQGGGGLMA